MVVTGCWLWWWWCSGGLVVDWWCWWTGGGRGGGDEILVFLEFTWQWCLKTFWRLERPFEIGHCDYSSELFAHDQLQDEGDYWKWVISHSRGGPGHGPWVLDRVCWGTWPGWSWPCCYVVAPSFTSERWRILSGSNLSPWIYSVWRAHLYKNKLQHKLKNTFQNLLRCAQMLNTELNMTNGF